jgi:hypothetical protein
LQAEIETGAFSSFFILNIAIVANRNKGTKN